MRFLAEEEVTTTAHRTDARHTAPSAAVLDARKRMNRARLQRDKAARKVGPVFGLLRKHLPVVYAAVQDYTTALQEEAASYRHLSRALAADLAEREGR